MPTSASPHGSTPYSDEEPELREAFRRGHRAGRAGKDIPRRVREGKKDVHGAWLNGYVRAVMTARR